MGRVEIASKAVVVMRRSFPAGIGFVLLLVGTKTIATGRSRRAPGTPSRQYLEARKLFEKVWVPEVASSEGGDGLGPLFNEQSCVGCHHQGGIGGAGDNTKSITILSAVPGVSVSGDRRSIFQGELEELHPGLPNRTSIVLHERATTKEDEARLAAIRAYRFVQSRDELFALCESKRSTPALFGARQIDRISDAALLEAGKRSFPDFPEITG